MQPVNPVLPAIGFAVESLLAPRQAMVAFFSRVSPAAPAVERVRLDDAFGRVLALGVAADDDYPQRRALGDGRFRARSGRYTGTLSNRRRRRMGAPLAARVDASSAMRIPTGGALPPGADAVVPIEEARDERRRCVSSTFGSSRTPT